MLNVDNGEKYSGHFRIATDDLAGELTFARSDTKLYVHSPSFFKPNANKNGCITGQLHGFTKVSLLECIAGPIPARTWSDQGRYNSANIIPHFVVYGRRHLTPEQRVIRSISFQLSDAGAIFQDYDSFFSPIETKPKEIRSFVSQIAKVAKRKIPTGQRPQIAIFTGRETIARAKTTLGTIVVNHTPWAGMGSSAGISIENRIWTTINFDKPTNFESAIQSLFPLLQFMEIMAGRKQEISDISLTLKGKDRAQNHVSVYWCDPPRRQIRRESKNVHAIDLPIDAVRERKLFESVIQSWLSRSETWKAARNRFSESFTGENYYTTDRLVGAANMFDLLPADAGPKANALLPEIKNAHDVSKKLFLDLPESSERESILNALGRLKQPNLKAKIRHRAAPIQDALGKRLEHLDAVLDLAVDARNFFVHGKSKYDFDGSLGPFLPFLTNSLEFVFAVSDLIESGWPIQNLRRGGTIQSHPFGTFLVNYRSYLDSLKAALPQTHKLNASVIGDVQPQPSRATDR